MIGVQCGMGGARRTAPRTFAGTTSSRGTGAFVCITNVAYWVYCGEVPETFIAKSVAFHMRAAGTGAQTAEVALACSLYEPEGSKISIDLRILVATGTVDSLLAGLVVKRNTNAFNLQVRKGTYLWAGLRTAMATTQPTVNGLAVECGRGHVLNTAAAGALTAKSLFTGSVIAANNSAIVPDLRVCQD